jgi:hypothetical protein
MGVVGRALRAAAAAAEDRVVVEAGSLLMKADVAAVAAFGLAVSRVRGCFQVAQVSRRGDTRMAHLGLVERSTRSEEAHSFVM